MRARTFERAARKASRVATEALQHLDPARFARVPRSSVPTTMGLVCIYRAENSDRVQRLLSGLPAGSEVKLWALDRAVPDLASLTVGTGPGTRLGLLNRLIAEMLERPDALVLSDDDVRIVVGDLVRLVRIGTALGFDLYQPAHSARSLAAFRFNRKERLLLARETTFVEQGPVVVLSPSAQEHLLPLPDELGMGWGVEVRWARTAEEHGLRMGVIDGVAIRHEGRRGSYDTGAQHEQLERELAAAGLSDLRDLQRTIRAIGPRSLPDRT